jgi:hypothetical protein
MAVFQFACKHATCIGHLQTLAGHSSLYMSHGNTSHKAQAVLRHVMDQYVSVCWIFSYDLMKQEWLTEPPTQPHSGPSYCQ